MTTDKFDRTLDRMASFATSGLLRQMIWNSVEEDGKSVACFLGSSSPEVKGVDDCPAYLAPRWVLASIPTMFDGMRREVALRPETATTMIDAWRKMGGAENPRWENAHRRWLAYLIQSALSAFRNNPDLPDYWPEVEDACLATISSLGTADRHTFRVVAATRKDLLDRARETVRRTARYNAYPGAYFARAVVSILCSAGAGARSVLTAEYTASDTITISSSAVEAAGCSVTAIAFSSTQSSAAMRSAREQQWAELAKIIDECASQV